MQFRKKILFAVLGGLFLIFPDGFGQKVLTNDKGETIIVYPDGRWEFYDEKKDSTALPGDNNNIKGIDYERVRFTSEKEFAVYDPEKDVVLNPPKPKCSFFFDGKDEITGQKRRDVSPQKFFSFTPPELANYFKNKDYITCRGNLTILSGGFLFLNLEFEIASKHAPQSFGNLPLNSLLNIKMIDGQNIRLLNNKENSGRYDPLRQVYLFKGQYPLNPRQERFLKKGEVDKVRVVWGTGYEDYEVYELDFFRDQFECLNSRK